MHFSMGKPSRKLGAFLLTAGLLLTSCSSSDGTLIEQDFESKLTVSQPPNEPSETISTSPSPNPSQKTTKPEIKLADDCAVMNPKASSVAKKAIAEYGMTVKTQPIGKSEFNAVAGPSAEAAMAKAKNVNGCYYPMYLSGQGVSQWTTKLSPKDQQLFIASLRKSGFKESKVEGGTSFSSAQSTVTGEASFTQQIDYLFIDDVLIAVISTAEGDFTGSAVKALSSAAGSAASDANGKEVPTQPQRPVASTTKSKSAPAKCSGLTGKQALKKWGPDVDSPSLAGQEIWDLSGQFSDVSNYDECAELSWIILRPEPCCTRFAVTPVLFFHKGQLVKASVEARFAVEGELKRISKTAVQVTYIWPGSDFAGPTNKATSSYVWDESAATVTRKGKLPPA